MLEKIILINSANFSFLDIDLKKDLFFLGDNGSGKTTVIRAIHFLFSGDISNLGIPNDKDSFKEYYFRYENSYIIYIFDNFFILMYKRGGEIVKIFSRQKFDISKIIDENRNLYEFSDIRKYARLANLKVTERGVDEYRKIIYGQNSRYLDFSLTSIKNYKVFITLFNQIFNIDKSIIDSKSIKQAIQKTLDYKNDFIDFDYESYLNQINRFQLDYKFFRDFENQRENIDRAIELKDELLRLETNIKKTKEYIVFRVKKEQEVLKELSGKLKQNSKKFNKIEEFKGYRKNILKRCKTKIENHINNLKLDIETIKRLKKKFTKESILYNQNLADRYKELKKELDRLNREKNILEEGLTNQIKSIDREIEELEYKRDKELIREKKDKEDRELSQLKESLNSEIEKLKLDFESFKESRELEIHEIAKNIEKINEEIESIKKEFQKERDKYNEDIAKLKLERDNKIDKQNRYISDIKSNILDLEQKIKRVDIEIDENSEEYERNKAKKEKEYQEGKDNLDIEIQKYKGMIYSKENSFKEFLNQEVDGWEHELYPILDDTLLDRTIDELKPKLIGGANLFAIKLDSRNLKKILTPIEVEEKIKKLNSSKKVMEESYIASLSALENRYNESISLLKNKKKAISTKITQKQELIKKIEESNEIEKWFTINKGRLDSDFKILKDRYKENINSLDNLRQDKIKLKKDIKDRINQKRQTLKKEIKELKSDYQQKKRKIESKLNYWLKEAKKKINDEISKKNRLKNGITKDDRLNELEVKIKDISIKKDKAYDAQKFLEEYSSNRELIGSLNQKENELQNIEEKSILFYRRVNNKIEEDKKRLKKIKIDNENINREIKKIEKGKKRYNKLEENLSDYSKRATDRYLFELIDSLQREKDENISKKIDLKTRLDKLNSLKNSHYLNIDFEFNEYDKYEFISDIPNIIDKLDEIIEFKREKIEIIKQTGHSKFRNFTNKLPSKIKIFNDIETKFLKQVNKVNKNLSSIDFGVIKDIKIETKQGEKKSIAKYLNELREQIATLDTILNKSSLWYDQREVIKELNLLENRFKKIKKELSGDAISLIDTINLTLSFNENGKNKKGISQIKNESSTGGSILLKMAIAISILKLFIKEDETPFFLIVDEVSRLHSNNQEKLREFANSKGFKIIFVTPEPTYSKPNWIKYYKFEKNSDNEFEVIELNR